jgi:lipopolysaccharide/colanic/teichoic acid biosynthesis glycosyltransferase
MESLTEIKPTKLLSVSLAYCGARFIDELRKTLDEGTVLSQFNTLQELNKHLQNTHMLYLPETILIEVETQNKELTDFLMQMKASPLTKGINIILLAIKGTRTEWIQQYNLLANDIYFYPFTFANILDRINFIYKFKLMAGKADVKDFKKDVKEYRMPFLKRAMDIVIALILLICAFPIMLVVAIMIKLDSKGPIFYTSKRAGTGYKIFDFYKFRSMRVNADKELAELAASLNQYAGEDGKSSAFVKLKGDPRVTKLGTFLRNTSLDELPQLYNVLKGDMSLVGNRPLPLYEAQQLTSDDWAMRFLGPAGITGLWQVTKRGKSEMSDEERRELDNQYANDFSFWSDVRIILKTIPALLQKEKV